MGSKPQPPWKPPRAQKVLGVKPPPKRGPGRPRGGAGMAELFMKMELEDCYDINRSVAGLYELARRLRRIYDVERAWIIRKSGRPGWSRVWRIK